MVVGRFQILVFVGLRFLLSWRLSDGAALSAYRPPRVFMPFSPLKGPLITWQHTSSRSAGEPVTVVCSSGIFYNIITGVTILHFVIFYWLDRSHRFHFHSTAGHYARAWPTGGHPRILHHTVLEEVAPKLSSEKGGNCDTSSVWHRAQMAGDPSGKRHSLPKTLQT